LDARKKKFRGRNTGWWHILFSENKKNVLKLLVALYHSSYSNRDQPIYFFLFTKLICKSIERGAGEGRGRQRERKEEKKKKKKKKKEQISFD